MQSLSGPFPTDFCVSITSILRCFTTAKNAPIHHILLIIPVALEVIFSTSLIFTNWGTGRRHLLLVAEGWVFFLLSLLELISHLTPAVRDHMSIFRAVDQSIGALSFTQLLFYMSFLYAFVRGEILPTVPTRIRRISRSLLLIFIPAVIAMNAVASFAGISYFKGLPPKPGDPAPTFVKFRTDQDHFVWTFFSALTLALLTAFQASCFGFAFYRLIRAALTQRKIETDSKDAAVLFKGIGWMNAGIKLGAIETVVGFVYVGVTIAYVRRIMRLFSRALLCIGVVKGIDATEDFKAIRDELESPKRTNIRKLISNPRVSTFRQLSPTATGFFNPSRGSGLRYSTNLGTQATNNGRPHPYATASGLFIHRDPYAQSPIDEKMDLDSPRTTTSRRLETDYSLSRQPSTQRVTVYFNHGTPKLHLRLSDMDLPSPAVIAESVKSRPATELLEEYRKSLAGTVGSRTPGIKGRTMSMKANEGWYSTSESNRTPREIQLSRFSATTRGTLGEADETFTVYPASTIARQDSTPGQNLYRYGSKPYGDFSSSPSSHATSVSRDGEEYATTSAAHGHSPDPPSPAYLDTPTRRNSGYASSEFSAASAQIIDMPRRKLSFSRQKSALARAVLYPVPPTKVAMALTEDVPVSKRPLPRQPSAVEYPSLPGSQRPSPPPCEPSPPPTQLRLQPQPQPQQQYQHQRESFVRQSIIDDDGNVITVTAMVPSTDDEYDLDTPTTARSRDRSTRALSGYSVRSVPETIQAVRELANKFPGPPPGAVVADIGIRAQLGSGLAAVREESSSMSGMSRSESSSTSTTEAVRRRIPAEMKMKGKQFSEGPSAPLPPIPQQQQQQQQQQQSRDISRAQFVPAGSIDPFDDGDEDGTSYQRSELSPLSMSIKLRHPMSFISNAHPPSTRRNSTNNNTALSSPVSEYSHRQSQMYSPEVVEFGAALKEWNSGGSRPAVTPPAGRKRTLRPMGDLPNLTMVEGHRRSISAKTVAEVQQQQDRIQKLPQQKLESQQPQQPQQKLMRIKSIGKAPRKITPTPTRGGYVRESMHLQPLIIPSSHHPDYSSASRDVPLSAVGAGGLSVISGVNASSGMNVQIMQDEAELSAVTEEGSNPRGGGSVGTVLRDSEVLSIEDGGYIPIRLQSGGGGRRRKGSF